jgi:NAD(P)-dependent dehydrogenase (short-subunit alcohol dehydrogenase family)
MSGPFSLAGRRVLVTGASSGIGRAIAVAISELGGEVVLVARDNQRLHDTLSALAGSGHSAESRDLAEVEAIPKWMKSVVNSSGPLSGLVHCAGVEEVAPIQFLSLNRFRRMQEVNINSALWLLKAFRQTGAHMANSSVVLITSIAGLVGQSGHAGYCATKGALIALAKAAAVELAAEGIRVNCVAPGWVEGTGITEHAGERLSEEQVEAIRAAHPLGAGRPCDVANAAAFLLSNAARWITGSTLVADGGYTAL